MILTAITCAGAGWLYFRARRLYLDFNCHCANCDEIEAKHDRVAREWRESNPKEKTLVIETEITGPELFAPTVSFRNVYKLDDD